MAYDESLKTISLDADASLGIYTGVPGLPGSAVPNTGKMYCFVKVTGVHQVGLAVLATNDVVGIMQNKPQNPGMAATIGYTGVSNLQVAGVVTAGSRVAPDATGRGVIDAVNGKWIALATSTVAGEIIPVLRAI
jgi:hypothetical protein